jgi:regulator of CtrA degradation
MIMRNDISFIDLNIKKVKNLLGEVHHYIKWQAPLDIEYMSREDIFKVSCEALRITVRLSQIMGWLMLEKAALDEDFIVKPPLTEKCRILQGKACLHRSAENDLRLPPRLLELLKETRELYERMMRLETASLKRRFLHHKVIKKRRQNEVFIPYLCYKRNTTDSR